MSFSKESNSAKISARSPLKALWVSIYRHFLLNRGEAPGLASSAFQKPQPGAFPESHRLPLLPTLRRDRWEPWIRNQSEEAVDVFLVKLGERKKCTGKSCEKNWVYYEWYGGIV